MVLPLTYYPTFSGFHVIFFPSVYPGKIGVLSNPDAYQEAGEEGVSTSPGSLTAWIWVQSDVQLEDETSSSFKVSPQTPTLQQASLWGGSWALAVFSPERGHWTFHLRV